MSRSGIAGSYGSSGLPAWLSGLKKKKMSPVNAGDTKDEVLIPGLERPPSGEDPLGKKMATHPILAWENLIQALGSQRARQD